MNMNIYSPGAPIVRRNSTSDSQHSPTATIRKRLGSSGSIQISPSGDHDDVHNNDNDDDSEYNGHNDSSPFLNRNEDEEEDADILDALAPGERTVGQFDLCGSMWKRRGGLGRNAERNWVMRCFTLYGPILCYHEEPDIESVTDPSKPRARLNLSKTEIIAEMHSKQKPGLPSEDLLTINIYDPIIHAKRKWEMCCTSKEQQLVWYRAINAFNGKPMEQSERAGSERAGGGGEHDTALSPVQTRYAMPDLSSSQYPEPRIRPSGFRGRGMDDVELIAKAAAKAAEILAEKQSSQKNGFSSYQLAILVVALNVAIHSVRNGTETTYKMTAFLMNVAILYLATQYATSKSKASTPRGPKARAARSKKKATDMEGTALSPKAVPPTQTSFAKSSVPVGKTIPRAAATKNSSLESLLLTHPPQSAESIRAYSTASSNSDSVQIQPHTYANTDAKTFHLRVGPNYKKNKQKAPSGPALYDLVSMDFLYADTSLKRTADKFTIPSIPGITDVSTGHAHIPPMLVINTWLPGEEPSMLAKSNTDGETYSIPMVLVLSKDTLKQLKDLDNASPGVKLLSEWCRRAENEPDFRGRFKCMGMIENIESTGVPKFIQGYNGKPALVTKSGTFKRHDNYIEFTVNVNMWAFLARKGLFTLMPSFPDFIFNVGFTIEARSDEEMPEVLLGGCRVLNLDPEKAAVDGVDV